MQLLLQKYSYAIRKNQGKVNKKEKLSLDLMKVPYNILFFTSIQKKNKSRVKNIIKIRDQRSSSCFESDQIAKKTKV